jgi:hypothetical protein
MKQLSKQQFVILISQNVNWPIGQKDTIQQKMCTKWLVPNDTLVKLDKETKLSMFLINFSNKNN